MNNPPSPLTITIQDEIILVTIHFLFFKLYFNIMGLFENIQKFGNTFFSIRKHDGLFYY